MRALVSGMVAGEPNQGGAAWAVLQYVLGLRRLGHEVVLVEPVESLQPRSVEYLRTVSEPFGLEQVALVGADGDSAPLDRKRLRELAAGADLLLNVSGMLTDPELLEAVPVRAYLDLDPFFNQVWQQQGADMRFAGHTHFVTVGLEIGAVGCEVPTLGLPWITSLPPVVLEEWPVAAEDPLHPFTTVGHWRSYGPIERDGRRYGMRAHSLRELIDLPGRCGGEFALALGIHPGDGEDIAALERHGWRLLDPAAVAATPDSYREFVRGSQAELGVAKEGYVESRSGWFSDRSACYLAAGRPVVAQETGFSRHLPTGRGLLAFSDIDEAATAGEEVRAHPQAHAEAARQIAEAYLDSDRVLARLLEELGVG
ncbi:MAG TPA: glycosyltransferase [Solirubrobacterales bacterium]|nr:glycosyltransferase [Solirubrobacterales bacterium]